MAIKYANIMLNMIVDEHLFEETMSDTVCSRILTFNFYVALDR